MVYQFKVQIKGITKPPVWRRLVVPAEFSFMRFHEVIQAAFGWEDDHLFQFGDKGYQSTFRIAHPSDDDLGRDLGIGPKTLDASKVKLSTVFTEGVRKLTYIYDFGDDWIHDITLEATSEEKRKTALCIAGKGQCPPEDCGGPYGYEEIKEVLQTSPDSKKVAEAKEQLGLDDNETWDVAAFDLEDANAALKGV